MKKRIITPISLLLVCASVFTLLAVFTSAETDPYLTAYGDSQAASDWIYDNITSKSVPPVLFTINGTRCDYLTWTKTCSETVTEIDYPTDNPKERYYYTITYYNEDYDIELTVTVTTYPDYPIVEYSTVMTYKGSGVSNEIEELYSLSSYLMDDSGTYKYHYSYGCNAGLPEYGADYSHDYNLFEKVLEEDESFVLSVTNGKPTSQYLPYMNTENTTANKGVITVISWQGNWTSAVMKNSYGYYSCARLNGTDFQLYPDETVRFPTMLLLFYKNGDWLNGQNIYRRWVYNHNLNRYSTKQHMPTKNVYLTTGAVKASLIDIQTDIECELSAFNAYTNSGMNGKGTYWVIDAGWYDYGNATSWFQATGNYFHEDYVRFPNGIQEFTTKLKENNLKFSIWIEPERIWPNTDVYNELTSRTFYSAYNSSVAIDPLIYSSLTPGSGYLINYSEPEVVNYMVDVVDSVLKLTGTEIYRQDFNTNPSEYWIANDVKMASAMGIKRAGLTENHYCQGYLSFMQQIADRNPGMLFDICASGSMRYDMETERYGYTLTRSDMFHGFTYNGKTYTNGAVCQNLTYVTSLWHVGMASYAVDQSSTYNTLSSVTTTWGVGIASTSFGTDLAPFAGNYEYWSATSEFSTGDFYPLTPYADQGSSSNVIFQFKKYDNSKGTIVFLARSAGTLTAKPRDIDPNASYRYHVVGSNTYYTITGNNLINNGISFTMNASEGIAIIYEEIN